MKRGKNREWATERKTIKVRGKKQRKSKKSELPVQKDGS
jgi:hypothetical protein